MQSDPIAADPPELRLDPVTLFLGFSRLALSGFGGVMPVAYRHLVEDKRWITAEDFAQMVAIGQILPGPTICNLAFMIGHRRGGYAGALAALLGMILGPVLVVVLFGWLYQQGGGSARWHDALAGMSAVAGGLILATAAKMGQSLFFSPSTGRGPRLLLALFGALAFTGVGVMGWPLIAVVLGLAPFAVFLAYRQLRA